MNKPSVVYNPSGTRLELDYVADTIFHSAPNSCSSFTFRINCDTTWKDIKYHDVFQLKIEVMAFSNHSLKIEVMAFSNHTFS